MKEFNQEVSIPVELDAVIKEGFTRGRIKMEKRARLKKNIMGITASSVIGICMLGVGINASPAFAASVKKIPVLGTLVKVFQINKENVSGGQALQNSKGEISLNREEGKELLIINFADSENADSYNAAYGKNPQSITITLPGTRNVELLSDYKRSEGESDFIKSVYKLITLDDSMVRYVVEIEDYSDVQISEYKDPGQIVIELTKNNDYSFDEIYSVRSYSYENGESFAMQEETLFGEKYRILKDDQELRFFEFAQFSSKEEAEEFSKSLNKMDTVVEERYGNNVPVCFKEKSDYESYKFINLYNDFLNTARNVEDITDFIDENKDKYPQFREIMIRGLTGMLRSMEPSEFNPKDYDKYYELVGTTTEEELAKYR